MGDAALKEGRYCTIHTLKKLRQKSQLFGLFMRNLLFKDFTELVRLRDCVEDAPVTNARFCVHICGGRSNGSPFPGLHFDCIRTDQKTCMMVGVGYKLVSGNGLERDFLEHFIIAPENALICDVEMLLSHFPGIKEGTENDVESDTEESNNKYPSECVPWNCIPAVPDDNACAEY